jgi:RNA polymerase sigma factor (sigma-70 family)
MPEAAMSDEEILALIQSPQTIEKGFRLLLEKYQERLYWHIRNMVFDHDDANDVFQNSMVKAFRAIGQFEQKSSLYTWLYRIATNEAITFLNQRKRRGGVSLDDGDNRLAQSMPADEYFDGEALHARLIEAMRKLPDKQRQVFILRYYEEMSYREMSDVLDTSEGALKASFHHAVKKIEQHFRESGEG